MKRCAYDIETNGLLDTVDTFHCAVAIDLDTKEIHKFRPWQLKDCVATLNNCELAVAHNGIKYDHPALEKLSGLKLRTDNQHDTLVHSKLVYSNLFFYDKKLIDNGKLDRNLSNSHSLKAWGQRLGFHKDSFGAESDWQTFSESMLNYCVTDVQVTVRLYEKLLSKAYPPVSVKLEHDLAFIMAASERAGFDFDVKNAERLRPIIQEEHARIYQDVTETFGSWYKFVEEKVPKRTVNYKDPIRPSTTQGAAYSAVKHVKFNPASRDNITHVFKERYGWIPEELTGSGKPKVDDEVLEKLNYPEAQLLARYFLLNKRLGQLATGKNAWLVLQKDSIIHGTVNTNGAVTGRATHSKPNIAQVPSCSAEFGTDCRKLFTVPKGYKLLGTDMSGLELRVLAHYLAPYDNGEYAREVVNGDVHTRNQKSAGLATRDKAKTFVYQTLYGAGALALGHALDKSLDLKSKRKLGSTAKKKFVDNTQGYKALMNAISRRVDPSGKSKYGRKPKDGKREELLDEDGNPIELKGLDGRKLHVRSAHSALNLLLQSAGALICKRWLIETDILFKAQGWTEGRGEDYWLSAWVHKYHCAFWAKA